MAYKSSIETDCTFLVGATIALGSRVISTGTCTSKTHPQNPKIKSSTKRNQLCAEVSAVLRALRKISKRQMKDCSIYVVRRRRDGSRAMAMPCIHCQEFLIEMGIKKIFYTNQVGLIKEMRN